MKIKIGNIRITINRYSETKESDVIRQKTLALVQDLNGCIDGKLFTTVALNYKRLENDNLAYRNGTIVINKFIRNNNKVNAN